MECESEFEAIVVGGWREGVLEKIVEEYKYQAVWAMGEVLAEVLDAALPEKGAECWQEIGGENLVVVPLPTIGRHVRERGLDHTRRIARKLARRRGWKCEQVLARAADTVQVGSKAAERQTQARKAYEVRSELDMKKTYILLDDVWTTGASMRAAAEVMRKAGAKKLIGLVVTVGKPREMNK